MQVAKDYTPLNADFFIYKSKNGPKNKFFIFVIALCIVLNINAILQVTLLAQNTSSLQKAPILQQQISQFVPVALTINSINVNNVQLEELFLTASGQMETPKKYTNAGWFVPFGKPGLNFGNSVIAGHLDNKDASPAVFWDLKNVKPGNQIDIEYSNSAKITFIVKEIYTQAVSDNLANKVFAQNTGKATLTIITCGGKWDNNAKSYTSRTVVFATLKE